MTIELKGRRVTKEVEPETGMTILELALKHDVDWGFSCSRGTCARCRCLVEEGAEFLSEPNDREWDRLDEEELEEGFRLGCQTAVIGMGPVKVRNKPYF
ncbi:hypothetical protein J31TS4_07630 [Paenibacillus sp. J31TS4]|uniref:2Fe-2S iron-sulfur cluster-binding protein n=1 Tax=Paenibacillus sp. J31TS4 TaxID=2807195 RepID=UPI001AFF2AD4|nr:2Fe-2S iron-sulfur cluster-binding protein [Paenibacillus sp. J31TS4]GIP37483.1 hypothetical protein J31TS4_07630 [Paenibacillus sp. J31TS4]